MNYEDFCHYLYSTWGRYVPSAVKTYKWIESIKTHLYLLS